MNTLSYRECLFVLPILNAEVANAKVLVGDLRSHGLRITYQEYLEELERIRNKIAMNSTEEGA